MGVFNKTEIVVIGVVHEIYKKEVLKYIDEYTPDAIGVEIRAEDINETKEYLLENYPSEMVEIVDRFPQIKTIGFDWLGEYIENKKLSREYWQNKSIKKLYREFLNDVNFQKERELLNIIDEKRDEIILNCSNVKKYNNGIDDILAEIYYKQFYNILNETQYEEYARFWKDRDRHIADNIINIIEENKGGNIVLVMGGDHKYFVIREIEKHFGSDIKLIKTLE
ncbi:hypothetical protein HMPREF1982_03434 [Clostridiales bacterium oral taxon 876 str. F0540]|nr:hypothetical protein HMPREF1982_03434 [Clostridiales bacterium oral taxon 876 str. F0540]